MFFTTMLFLDDTAQTGRTNYGEIMVPAANDSGKTLFGIKALVKLQSAGLQLLV